MLIDMCIYILLNLGGGSRTHSNSESYEDFGGSSHGESLHAGVYSDCNFTSPADFQATTY